MVLLVRRARWAPGLGRRVGQGPMLTPTLGHGDEGRCIVLPFLTPTYSYFLKIPERQAGIIAHHVLHIGGIVPETLIGLTPPPLPTIAALSPDQHFLPL